MTVADVLWMLLLLLGWHALADYPLQGDFLSRAKNHTAPIPGVPWYQALGAHALIQGVGVMYITGNVWLGLAEVGVHAWIDFVKCEGVIGYNADQMAHVLCKLAWLAVMVHWGRV